MKADPRALALRHPHVTVLLVAVITAVMLLGNYWTRKGSFMDDSILDRTNVKLVSDLYVRSRASEGFRSEELIPFVLRFPGGISAPADLRRIRDFTEDLKRAFGPGVLSVAEVRDYRDTGTRLLDDHYIPQTIADDFDVESWKTRIKGDPTVFGVFVGRDFEWAIVARYLPADYDEIGEFRRTVEFLEGRRIPWWEWLYKGDIDAPENVGVAGWVVGRGLVDQALTVEDATLVGLGIALTLPILAWSLGSWRDAFIGMGGVVFLGLVWTRGTIGLLAAAGVPIKERLIGLLIYINCIVQGLSFVLHKFAAGHDGGLGRAQDRAERIAAWHRSFDTDRLIGGTALIAFLGFATLYTFQVRTIRELGILSGCGVVYLLVLVTVFLPALHAIVARPARHPDVTPNVAAALDRLLGGLARAWARLVLHAPPRRAAWRAGGATLGITLLALLLIWPGKLLLVTNYPLEALAGTLVHRTGHFLNEPHRLGFDLQEFLVEPIAPASDLRDPAFLEAASRFEQALHGMTDVREVVSILPMIRRVSEESLRRPLPVTRQEAAAVLTIIEGGLDTHVARQLFHSGGLRVSASYTANDTARQNALSYEVTDLARARFPTLRVSSFGRSGLFGEMDNYIRVGKPWNLLTSQSLVIGACGLAIWMNNRRRVRTHMPMLRPIAGAFMMSAPLLFATATMAITMIALGIPLDGVTATITALALNASVDFTLYYGAAYQEGLEVTGTHAGAVRHATAHKGIVVLGDMLLNSVCFLPLVLSRFYPVRDTGWMMSGMLVASAFGALVVMPALFGAAVRPGEAGARQSIRPTHAEGDARCAG